jgi:hypothetical protein
LQMSQEFSYQPTQEVQHVSGSDVPEPIGELWGYLDPLNKQLPRLLFSRNQLCYYIGRSDHPASGNDYILRDPRISE